LENVDHSWAQQFAAVYSVSSKVVVAECTAIICSSSKSTSEKFASSACVELTQLHTSGNGGLVTLLVSLISLSPSA
jgi:hypothetical protein